MKLSKEKLEVILARRCMCISDLKKQNIHCSTLSNISKGNNIQPKTAGKIASALGVDVTEIMEDKED